LRAVFIANSKAANRKEVVAGARAVDVQDHVTEQRLKDGSRRKLELFFAI
jgi:hypothetical protein